MKVTENQADIIYHSLSMRKNFIQTGDALVDAESAERRKMPLKLLSLDQMKLVIDISAIMDDCLAVLYGKR
jgi:hypothetical protein